MADNEYIVASRNLEKAVDLFNSKKGRLRVSLTTACQCICSFCHKEGNDTSNDSNSITTQTYKNLVAAFSGMGGLEINITGGEPLLHPDIRDIIRFGGGFDFHRTISTNALAIDQLFGSDVEEACKSYEFKISLHSLAQETSRELMGENYDVEHVKANIIEAKDRGFNIILNLTFGDYNNEEVYGVIDFALRHGLNIKISDLGKTEDQNIDFESSYTSLANVIAYLERVGSFKRHIVKNMGNKLYLFTSGKSRILVKDMTTGKYATEMCVDCQKEEFCSEGVFALRYTTSDEFKPCLLRDDFNLRVADYYDDPEQADFSRLLPRAIYKMINGEIRKVLDEK